MGLEINNEKGQIFYNGNLIIDNGVVNNSATVAPTVTDDSSLGYAIGSTWVDTTSGRWYVCTNATVGAAVWHIFVQVTTDTGSAMLPAGTTAQRDATPQAGWMRFNTTTTQFEGYNGSVWTAVGGGATGGGADQVFVENDQVITTSYTIPTGKNASSVGPLTVNSGVVVTVSTGSRWVVL